MHDLRFKNVIFEISTTEEPGIFEVSAKFMGVTMEKVDLVFQVGSCFFLTTTQAYTLFLHTIILWK